MTRGADRTWREFAPDWEEKHIAAQDADLLWRTRGVPGARKDPIEAEDRLNRESAARFGASQLSHAELLAAMQWLTDLALGRFHTWELRAAVDSRIEMLEVAAPRDDDDCPF